MEKNNTLNRNTCCLYIFCFLFLLTIAQGCGSVTKHADSIYYNAVITTMDSAFPKASVIVVKDGKILAIGGEEILKKYTCDPEFKFDLEGRYIYPGLIDAHCHFYGYAKNLLTCNLVSTVSWEEVLSKLTEFARLHQQGWLYGRGWDQNDWEQKSYPDNSKLNYMFPDRPVILKRIDGHAAICNIKALELAGIKAGMAIEGGEALTENGKLTGVLIDNAVDLVEKTIPETDRSQMESALKTAEYECFSYGLTTLADAGLPLKECLMLDSMGMQNKRRIFLYMMLNPDADALDFAKSTGIYENRFSRIASFKLYGDGSLGSRGARLKHPYHDRPGHSGYFIHSTGFYDSFCQSVYNETGYQLNTHCIGDSSNRLIMDLYGKCLKGKNDRRWRIEHAQVIDFSDFNLFSQYSIVPSVQPTHAGSDAPWAGERIGGERLRGAYAYRTLMKQNGYIALGTDFPVEQINPFLTFFSAVFRMEGNRPGSVTFLPEEALSRMEALKGMTIWAARSCFLEHRKGSLSVNKDADFFVLDKDLFKTSPSEIPDLKAILTIANGKMVYGSITKKNEH